MVFFPLNTWVSLRNTGTEPIQLIFIFSAPGFDEYMRCSSVPEGQPAPPIPLEDLSKCAHEGHVEYEALSGPRRFLPDGKDMLTASGKNRLWLQRVLTNAVDRGNLRSYLGLNSLALGDMGVD